MINIIIFNNIYHDIYGRDFPDIYLDINDLSGLKFNLNDLTKLLSLSKV